MGVVSKPWACAVKRKTKEYQSVKDNIEKEDYVVNDKGRIQFYSPKYALYLKKHRTEEFEKLIFVTKRHYPTNRRVLTPVNAETKHFKFPPNTKDKTPSNSDGESLSHELAILALSHLTTFNFLAGKEVKNKFWGNNNLKLKCTEVEVEPTLRLSGGKQYRPDLMCKFDEKQSLYTKWGGKLAIEVKYTHEVPAKKRWDFENHSIPIIEISLSNKLLFKPEVKNEEFSQEDIDSHIQFLVSEFTNYIPHCELICDPVSLRWHFKKSKEYKQSVSDIEEKAKQKAVENEKLMDQLDLLHSKYNSQVITTKNLRGNISSLNERYDEAIEKHDSDAFSYKASLEKINGKLHFWRWLAGISAIPYIVFILLVIYNNANI